MHVAGLLPVYPPAARFGAPLATHQLLTRLVERGHTVTVARSMGWGAGYEYEGIQVARSLGLDGWRQAAETADVVVSHGGSVVPDQYVNGKPHVRIAHGFDADDLDVELVACNSRTLQDHLTQIGRLDPERSIVCPPVTLEEDHQVDQAGDAVTIVNCSKDKGIITAWKCAEQLPDHHFLGVQGGYGQQTEPRSPNFQTITTQPDMKPVWEQTRVLLMPSAYETWGMAGVEAMCSGIPVIAHPTPGLQESLGDAGIFIDRDDIDSWAEAILGLDNPDVYETASARARARFEQLTVEMETGLNRFVEAVEALL